MPTYAYRCKSCSHEFEELQRIADEPLKVCPNCHKPALVRIIGGGAGLHFKGSGFYLTDYKKSSSGGGESSDTGKAKKKADEKTDSPAKKSDSTSNTSSGSSDSGGSSGESSPPPAPKPPPPS